jgi:hypothetical protein
VVPPPRRARKGREPAIAVVLATTVLCAAPSPSAADFYDLNGRFECLAVAGAVCYDATPSPAEPPPAKEEPPAEPSAEAPPQRPDGAPPGTGKPAGKATPVAAADPLREIAQRLQARKPEPNDLAALEGRAKQGDARAIEMLAWCHFAGVGVPRDPVRAYFLYGDAATAGAPTGRQNQRQLFERGFTPEQRQQVLQIENGQRQH